MGTRSLTFVYANDETKPTSRVMCLYRQFDGYPSGHGMELHNFLRSGEMVNGYSDSDAKQFNGMGCCAAQMVAHFKDGVGSFYLYPTNTKDAWQEYEYHIYHVGGWFNIKVIGHGKKVFEGNLVAFKLFCEKY